MKKREKLLDLKKRLVVAVKNNDKDAIKVTSKNS